MAAVARTAARCLVGLAVFVVAACGGGDAPAGGETAAFQPQVLTIPEEVERMKDVLPSQSHLMASVGYYWSELWFAAQNREWDLAQSHFEEARSHIKWMIRIHPTRADAQGKAVDLETVFGPIDAGAFNAVNQAMTRRDASAFATAYRRSLEACYECHKISGRPYLRPMIPVAPTPTSVTAGDDVSKLATRQSRPSG